MSGEVVLQNTESNDDEATSIWAVNKRMVPSKIAYILSGGHLGSHIAFLNLFFTSVGLSPIHAGIITGMNYASPIITGPIWGYVADFTGRRKLVLCILCLGGAFPIFSMPWIARSIYPLSMFKCNATMLNATGISFVTNQYSGISYSFKSHAECEVLKEAALKSLYQVLLAIIIIASSCLVPLPTYIDTIVMNVVKTSKSRTTYGQQRIYGSFGFSIANFFAGMAADHYQQKDMSQYTAVFFLFLPYTLMLIPVGCFLIDQIDEQSAHDSVITIDTKKQQEDASDLIQQEESVISQVLRLLLRLDTISFFGSVIVCGFANNVFMAYSYMLVQNEMLKTKTEMTMVVIVATLSETLMFPFTSKIIKILGSCQAAIIIGTASYAVRFLIMSRSDVYFPMFVSVQCLSSLGFALSWAAMMEHLHNISTKEISLTMNAIMMTLYFSLSNLAANMIGGRVYQIYGGRKLFLVVSILCSFWTLLMIVDYGGKKMRRYLRKRADTSSSVERCNGGIKTFSTLVIENDQIKDC